MARFGDLAGRLLGRGSAKPAAEFIKLPAATDAARPPRPPNPAGLTRSPSAQIAQDVAGKAKGALHAHKKAKSAIANTKKAMSKEGRGELLRQFTGNATSAAKQMVKQIAKQATKQALKASAKAAATAAKSGAVACVGSGVCLLVVAAVVLLLIVVGSAAVAIMFAGGSTQVVEDSGSGIEAVQGHQRLADPDDLLEWWRLNAGGPTNHPVSLIERWFRSGAPDSGYSLRADIAETVQERSCDLLIDGYTAPSGPRTAQQQRLSEAGGFQPADDGTTKERMREELDFYASDDYERLSGETAVLACQKWWAAAAAWDNTLFKVAGRGIPGLPPGGLFPVRSAVDEGGVGIEQWPRHDYDALYALSLALWRGSGFGETNPSAQAPGFAVAFYSNAGTKDPAVATVGTASKPPTGRSYGDIAHCGDSPPGNNALIVPVPVECAPPPNIAICPTVLHYRPSDPPPETELPERVTGGGVLPTAEKGPPPPLTTSDGEPHPALMCSAINAAQEQYWENNSRSGAGRDELVWWGGWWNTRGGPAWHGCVTDDGPSAAAPQPRDSPWALTFCADRRTSVPPPPPPDADPDADPDAVGYEEEPVWIYDPAAVEAGPVLRTVPCNALDTDRAVAGEEVPLCDIARSVIRADWVWTPPPVPVPQFGKLLAAELDWTTNRSVHEPAAARAFAMAELYGWEPRYGLSPVQRRKLQAMRGSAAASNQGRPVGDIGKFGCPRLFQAIAAAFDDADCVEPSVQQMRLWGWGPHFRQSSRPPVDLFVLGGNWAQDDVHAAAERFWRAVVGDSEVHQPFNGTLLSCADPPTRLTRSEANSVAVVTETFAMPAGGGSTVTLSPCLMPHVAGLYDLARQHGVRLAVVSTYRSYRQQFSMCSDPEGCGGPVPVAAAGTSRHQFGMAIDFAGCRQDGDPAPDPSDRPEGLETTAMSSGTVCHHWMTLYGWRFGLFPFYVEPWHWSVDAR